MRTELVSRAPYGDIGEEDLPDAAPSEKHPLTLEEGTRIHFEEHWSKYVPWLALRLFLRVRTKEAERFAPGWVHRERKLIRIPGFSIGSSVRALKRGVAQASCL